MSDVINILIRKGNENNARGVIEVNTYTWLTAYKGLKPDKVLENRVKTMDERVTKIADSIRKKDNLYIAVDNGIFVVIMLNLVLPFITDKESDIKELVRLAR